MGAIWPGDDRLIKTNEVCSSNALYDYITVGCPVHSLKLDRRGLDLLLICSQILTLSVLSSKPLDVMGCCFQVRAQPYFPTMWSAHSAPAQSQLCWLILCIGSFRFLKWLPLGRNFESIPRW